jgi:hypothetical protein
VFRKTTRANLWTLQPAFFPQKPIIVGLDDRLASPDTIALRLEEARRGSLGDDTSPRLLEMAAYSKAAPLPSMNGKVPAARGRLEKRWN